MSIFTTSLQTTTPGSIFLEWYRREPTLALLTIGIAFLLPFLYVLAAVDDRTINDVSIWSKPLKFHIATALYTGTLAWFCGWIDRSAMKTWWYRLFTNVVIFCVVVELLWLSAASFVGEPSHFNRSHKVLSITYPFMGVVAVLFTSATVFVAVLIAWNKQTHLAPYFRNMVVAGLLISFFLTVKIAGELASMESHWIGGTPSDANGLALFGWSRDGGDLRVAHFFALHAMHFLPLFALVKLPQSWLRWHILTGTVASITYTAFVLFTYYQAKQGLPFMPWLNFPFAVS